jgi:hypothetical protein
LSKRFSTSAETGDWKLRDKEKRKTINARRLERDTGSTCF